MTNPNMIGGPQRKSTGSGCARALGIGCVAIVVFLVLILLWINHFLKTHPEARKAVQTSYNASMDMTRCQQNLLEIGGGLQRYVKRNGSYPKSLSELSPDFLKSSEVLHCPADSRPKSTVSYTYTPPAMNAPGDTVVVTCKRHVFFQGQPPVVLVLTKDGKSPSPKITYPTSPSPFQLPEAPKVDAKTGGK